MISLEEARAGVGRKVRYNSQGADCEELGVVSSVNDSYVFVLYLGDRIAKATNPASLDWA